MSDLKRRGRPVGTDYKEDFAALALVADRMVADSKLKASPTMFLVCKTRKWKGQSDKAIVARWLRKWQSHGARLLDEARGRQKARHTPSVTLGPSVHPTTLAAVSRTISDLEAKMENARKMMEMPGFQAMLDQHRKAVEAFAMSPVYGSIQHFAEQMQSTPHSARSLYELTRTNFRNS